jgi:hypothetical protein
MSSTPFNGLNLHLGNLSRLSNAQSRSISPENPDGAKGKGAMAIDPTYAPAADLGQGWKVRPYITIPAGSTATLADISGPGAIQQIWLTAGGNWRHQILRVYWDHQQTPSIETPLGDFFCSGWAREDHSLHTGPNFRQLSSLAVCVNPHTGFNCYWQMPFRKHCRITLENLAPANPENPKLGEFVLFYQINYTLTDVPPDTGYLHAQFRRSNPLPYKSVHTLLDNIHGQGHYVGTYLAWGVHNNGWWGEGEIKFYLDDDKEFPTICGTGTEDYFCGSYNFDVGAPQGGYREFTTPYSGLHQVIKPDGLYNSQQRFGMYRWHIMDPIRFQKNLRVTIQALGWRKAYGANKYLPLQDDIASTSFWYQTLPTTPFPPLPNRDQLEVI